MISPPILEFQQQPPTVPPVILQTRPFLQFPLNSSDSKNNDGDIVLDLTKLQRHSNLCQGTGNSFLTDTTVYRFWTKDKAGNVSDTAVSQPIIIHP